MLLVVVVGDTIVRIDNKFLLQQQKDHPQSRSDEVPRNLDKRDIQEANGRVQLINQQMNKKSTAADINNTNNSSRH